MELSFPRGDRCMSCKVAISAMNGTGRTQEVIYAELQCCATSAQLRILVWEAYYYFQGILDEITLHDRHVSVSKGWSTEHSRHSTYICDVSL